ncbi:hypothetical protein M413DRAFT_144907 [Hebeloma cylindrosporum]|uniref:F-box domain-containing protein n=1 Tax=Hebeloma cylindrosporum TaxID=76867 RepID=A0A0C3CAK4_HEBCY|nr:hypothetical protein M413DRAFT_144907 [Hebeloma cylindrosporum h7]
MHHCLHIEEILGRIFEFVLYDVVGTLKTYDKRSVLALSKTCRIFHMPALQVLWKNLFNAVPLLLTMPDDLWQVEDADGHAPRTLSFKRDVRPDDWERFDMYASFVRHLGVGEMQGQGRSSLNYVAFGASVRQQLESRTPTVSLLPNVRSIVSWTNDIPLTSLFLAPRVHYLKIVMHSDHTDDLSSLAREIPLRSPNLRSLHLTESSRWNVSQKAQFIDALAEVLRHLQLEEFVCSWFPLSVDMLSAVLEMPDLRSMAIYATMPDLAQVMDTHPIRDARIRKFTLRTPLLVPSLLPHIISSLHPSILESLSITARCASCNAGELTDLISTLANTCSPEHLSELCIDSGRHDPVNAAAAVMDFKILKPLLPFMHLRRISLPAHPFALTDAEVKDMAMAWPNLEDLCFWQCQYTVPEGSSTPRPSLRGLLWLATYCRKLFTLTFPFHSPSADMEEFTEDEMGLCEGHNLNFLDVGFSEIESAERVARFVSRVFPNLTLLAFRVGQPYYGRWETVQELIQHS